MTSRRTANITAAVAFLGVLLLGAYLLGTEHKVSRPTTTTVVIKSAVQPTPGSKTSTETIRIGKGRKKTTRSRTRTMPSGRPQSSVTTTVVGGQSFLERLLGDEGEAFLRIGAILLAAFIAAAAIQRVLLGQYGGIKLGRFEVREVATASDTGLKQLGDAVSTLSEVQRRSSVKLAELEASLARVENDLRTTKADSLDDDAELNRTLGLVTARLDRLEKQLHDGGT